jgi:tetratricopeptide (TPR) repeat protein
MWDLAVREEDYAKADSLLRRKFTPEKLPLGHRALLASVRRDPAALRRLLDEMKQQTSGYPFAPEALALYLNDFRAASDFSQAALASPRPRATKASVHQGLAMLALAQGRWTDAKLEFAQAERALPSAKPLHALSATLPFIAVPSSDLMALQAKLEAWNPSSEAPEPNPGLASALRPQVRLYLLALLSSRRGNDAQALQHAVDLERTAGPPEAGAVIQDFVRTIRADIALRRGRPADALKILEPVKGEVPAELLAAPFFSEEASRYLRAEAFYQLGRNEEALRWFSHGFEGTPSEVIYVAPAHLRRAELYERLGDRKQAVEHYSRFVHAWNGCDPQLRPRVTEAKARIAALVAEPR